MAERPARIRASHRSNPDASTDADTVITLTELAEEVGDRAASPAATHFLEGHECVGPSNQSVPGVEVGEEVALAVENGVVGGIGDGQQQVVLVIEVVVELAARGRRPGADLIQARPERPLLGHHLGCRGHDACAGLASPVGARHRSHGPQYPDKWT